jgi:CRISPR/Cas system CSM-associated protein Csm3 (group 7 of RAMP superfamily)
VLRAVSNDYSAWLNFKRFLGLDLDYIRTYVEIEAVVVNETPLRVGSGRGEGLGEVDLPIVKDSNGLPFIPGSSLKGVFRSWLESIHSPEETCRVGDFSHDCCSLKAELIYKFVKGVEKRFYKGFKLRSDELRQALTEIDPGKVVERYRNCINAKEIVDKFSNIVQDIAKDVQELEVEFLVDRLREGLVKERLVPCVVCRLFGNKAMASHVSISDAKPVDTNVKTFTRTRVAIDRFTKTALPKALFDYEYVPEGYKWRFKIIAWNIDVSDKSSDTSSKLQLLLETLASIGLFVGSMKSVGHGLLKLVAEESKARICRFEVTALRCETKSVKELMSQR